MYPPTTILLNKYRIEELIGQGTFGQVYRVTHLQLGVQRALKILSRDAPGLGSTEYKDYRDRFRLEAQLGARLNTPTQHPHLVNVYNFETAEDLLVLEMEYAPEGSLAKKLDILSREDKYLPALEAAQIGLDVAQGLAALHAVDAVHRDLKLSNILFDKQGRAKVADLGLAQIRGGPSMRSRLSDAPLHPGTPGYMSPEQVHSTDYLTPASDVYSLGLVLFEILTNRMFRSQRPGTRVIDFRGDIPEWLDNLLVRMLSKDVEDRPWDGGEVAGLLQKGLDRENQLLVEQNALEEAERATQTAAVARAQQQAEEEAQKEAERHAQELAQLEQAVNIALENEDWATVEGLLHTLEETGQASKLRLKYKRAQDAAVKRAEDIQRLRAQIVVAISNCEWETVRYALDQAESLGSNGLATVRELHGQLEKILHTRERILRRNELKNWLQKNALTIGWLIIFGMLLFSIFDWVKSGGSGSISVIETIGEGVIHAESATLPVNWTSTPTLTKTVSPSSAPSETSTGTPTLSPTAIPVAQVIAQLAYVRFGPGTNFRAIEEVHNGDVFNVIGRSEDGIWIVVQLVNEQQGWIEADKLDITVDLFSIPVITTTPTPPPVPVFTAPTTRNTQKPPRPSNPISTPYPDPGGG